MKKEFSTMIRLLVSILISIFFGFYIGYLIAPEFIKSKEVVKETKKEVSIIAEEKKCKELGGIFGITDDEWGPKKTSETTFDNRIIVKTKKARIECHRPSKELFNIELD